ncbi:gluconokinase [Alkalihalobacillus sp. LMS39]|uniref:gluconokinase n=1 Tax=Alkalihalobacillus sp. LMS39 TaxID=2924032 RepID=UPI001FB2C12C|nr:gluconokinase [Alkalihalobacillus sp. LMS39]UOE92013.1 gluconokinase [Alkalihalobacillus sp. LMS39]
MDKEYVFGLDIGTTSAKAVLFQRNGQVIAEQEQYYPIYHEKVNWAEQNPDEIERACRLVIHALIEKSEIPVSQWICGGISAAMHSLICVNEKIEALSPAIIWADQRSLSQAKQLTLSYSHLYEKTGTPLHPMSPLAKLIWLKESKVEAYQQAAYFISIKEYIIYKWFGEKVVDYSIASATGLFNIHNFCWEEESLKLAGISSHQLFTPVDPTFILHNIRPEVSKNLMLPAGFRFVLGASDGPLANLGIGAIRRFTSTPRIESQKQTFCYAFTKDLWIVGGPTNNGGNVLEWMKSFFDYNYTHEQLLVGASQSTIGANGLLCLPYLHGERAPLWDANAKGTFIGINPTHTRNDFVRSALEGVILALYHVANSMLPSAEQAITSLYASGGFARSPLWLQIVADVFYKEVIVPKSHQSSAWGAAWLALYALDEVSSLQQIKSCIPIEQSIHPNKKNHKTYEQLFLIYQSMSVTLRHTFDDLTNFQQFREEVDEDD